ncbi:diacylglycerol kinase [Paenibacillus cymbidii]|uniref:diacylglycerol kinase n=1 Tax=Paenibacillus cymbidii TaxID=1639034 RepID=UPI001081D1A4|nr:diacylglycerol kinase [Paenibacillus cymbidii]
MNPWLRWLRSFRFAYEGIKYALSTQPNMKFHFFASIVVLVSALFFHLPKSDILFIFSAVALVIVTELINTAIEKAVDLAMPERHPIAKIAKDTAAAAVLVAAAYAVVVGAIIFYEPIDRWLRREQQAANPITPDSLWLYFALVALTVIVMQTRFSHSKVVKPSLWMAIAFSMSTLIAMIVPVTIVALLAYSLSVVFLFILYERRNRSLLMLLFGAVVGIVITLLAFYLNQ